MYGRPIDEDVAITHTNNRGGHPSYADNVSRRPPCKSGAGPIARSGRLRGQTSLHQPRQAGRLGKLAPLRSTQTCPADFPPPDMLGSADSTGRRGLVVAAPCWRLLKAGRSLGVALVWLWVQVDVL